MSLEISKREREGVAILDLKGRITAGEESTIFRDAFEAVAGAPDAKLILNMKQVDYVDSTGLGSMVMCAKRAMNSSGSAKLEHVNRRNIELLVMTKIDTFFEVFDDETEAVNSFFPDREIKRFDILSFVQNLQDE
jgi:anti-sigma B factor antagonist